ncbi:MAG: hypothetical protein LBV74_12620 [Tannerella sp.]|jgi:hypothetical protein|nr:hypothetical protein [Tannerella sp.]
MYKQLIIAIAAFVCLAGCGKGKEAQKVLNEAKSMYENKQFIAAKSAIDSINIFFPREIEVRKEALTLMRLVEKGECEQNIAYCDSLLPIRIGELDDLKKGFIFEKDTAYDETGNYIWNTMTVERNVERSYIRCGVNEEGEMYMASVYFGSSPIEHTGLKLSVKDGTFAETPSIPYDGGVNYRFKDMGNTTEVVTYKGEDCKTVANFVSIVDQKERIKAEYAGGKPYSLYLSDTDKKAIKATYELALVLNEINAMRKEKEKSEKKIMLIDHKFTKNELEMKTYQRY